MTECSLCGRQMRSPSGIRAHCRQCQAPLCFYCVMVDGASLCSTHAAATLPKPEPVRTTCAVCGKWPVDVYTSGQCAQVGCGERLCNDCLALGARTCPDHAAVLAAAPVPTSPSVAAAEPLAQCAFCGRSIATGETSSQCAESDCDSLLCSCCVGHGQAHCGQHLQRYGRRSESKSRPVPVRLDPAQQAQRQPTTSRTPTAVVEPEAGLAAATDPGVVIAELPPAVPANASTTSSVEARTRASNFLARFRRAASEPREVTIGLSGRRVILPGWARPSAERSGQPEVSSLIRRLGQSACAPELCPTNSAIEFGFAPRSWYCLGRRRRKLLLEARSMVRPARYLRFACDWEPVTIEDLLPELERLSRRAQEQGYFHVICLFSPTGWDTDVVELLANAPATRRLVLPELKVVLVGPAVDEFHLNVEDLRAAELDDLFPLALAEERLPLTATQLRNLIGGRSGIALDEVVEELGCDIATARAAFRLLADGGDFEIICLRGKSPLLAKTQ